MSHSSDEETHMKQVWSSTGEDESYSASDYEPVFSEEDDQVSLTRQTKSTSSTPGSQEDEEPVMFEDGTLAEGTLAGLSLEEKSDISKQDFTRLKTGDQFEVYPSLMHKRLKDDYPEILQRLHGYLKGKNHFIFCAPCLFQSLDQKGRRTIPINIICDVCIFFENEPTLILTFRNITRKKDRLYSYNAELGRYISDEIRRFLKQNFSAVFGVIDKESCQSSETFAERIVNLQDAARKFALPSSLNMNRAVYRVAIHIFVTMLPLQKKNPVGPDIGRKIFIERNGFEKCKSRLKSHQSVVIVAPPGEGKTLMGYSLLRHFRDTVQENGHRYEPIILNEPEQWHQLVDKDSHQIILIDDIFGLFALSRKKFQKWSEILNQMTQSLVSGLKLLVMTLRYNIFHDHIAQQMLPLFQPECCVDLWFQHRLQFEDRLSLLKKHSNQQKLQIKDEDIVEIAAANLQPGFPQQCRSITYLSMSTGTDLKELFKKPSPDLDTDLHNLQTYEPPKYALLVVVAMNDGVMKINAQSSFLKDVMDCLKCPHKEDYSQLLHECGSLFGIYLEKDTSGNITFYHSYVQDIVTFSFSQQCPNFVIQHGSIRLISELFIVDKEGQNQSTERTKRTKLRLTKRDEWDKLAKRFVDLIHKGEVADVCMHQAFSENEFIDIFIKQKKIDKKLLQRQDAKHSMPLLYWSACNKNTHFCERILFLMKEQSQTVFRNFLSRFGIVAKDTNESQIKALENAAMAALLSDNPSTLKYVFSYLQKESKQKIMKLNLPTKIFPTFPARNQRVTYSKIKDFKSVTEFTILQNYYDILKYLYEDGSVNEEDLKIEIEKALISMNRNALHTILKSVVTDLGHKQVLRFMMEGEDGVEHTYLCMAVQTGSLDMVKLLIEADDEMVIKDCCKPLLEVCLQKGHIHIAEYLFKFDPSTFTSLQNHDILLKLCEKGDVRAVRLLLQNGHDVNSRNKSGLTLLQIACSANNNEMLKVLLQHSPDVLRGDSHGNTILHRSVLGGAVDVVSTLITNTRNAVWLINNGNSHKDTALFLAVEQQQDRIAKILLEAGADVNITNADEETALHSVCKKTNPDMVSLLLHKNARVNMTNTEGRSPLHFACHHGNAAIIKQLLDNEANVNLTDLHGNTPLLIACKVKGKEELSLLLKKGADVRKQDRNFNTPLHMACKANMTESVIYLLENNAPVHAKNVYGLYPLHVVCKHSDTTISVSQLVDESIIDLKDNAGNAPLHSACESQNSAAVQTLLKKGADINLQNSSHHTPLCIVMKKQNADILKVLLKCYQERRLRFVLCVASRSEEGCGKAFLSCCTSSDPEEILSHYKALSNMQEPLIHHLCRKGNKGNMELLLLQGMPPDSQGRQGKGGNSCLQLACERHKHGMIKLLMKYHANPGLRNHLNNTAFHTAAEIDCSKAVKLMLSKNSKRYVNSQNSHGDTALHVASRHQNIEIMELFLSCGADINIRNTNNEAVIHTACKTPDAKIVEMLLNRGSKVNQTSKDYSPLHIACSQANLAVVQVLVRNKADINMSISGETPLHVAEMNGRTGIVNYLLEKGANRLATDRKNRTPLAYRYHADGKFHITPTVESLLNHNSDVNTILQNGETPIIHEVRANHFLVVKELVRRGADVNVPDLEGRTPENLARYLGYEHMALWLAKRGLTSQKKKEDDKEALYLMSDCI